MAGQLTIDTLKTSSGVFNSNNAISGFCNAWVLFVGSSGSVVTSFNVSSVTRSGVGIWQMNFTTAMPDSNFAVVTGISSFSPNNGAITGLQVRPQNSGSGTTGGSVGTGKSTTYVQLQSANYANTMNDNAENYVAIFR